MGMGMGMMGVTSGSAQSGRSTASGAGGLSGTRMVEYTTEVRVPLYIWMDPYADFE